MSDLQNLSEEELRDELEKAQAELEDLQEERRFTLGQTGVHMGAARVELLQSQWEREERELNEKIAAIRACLQEA
jgi:hypothetical protein